MRAMTDVSTNIVQSFQTFVVASFSSSPRPRLVHHPAVRKSDHIISEVRASWLPLLYISKPRPLSSEESASRNKPVLIPQNSSTVVAFPRPSIHTLATVGVFHVYRIDGESIHTLEEHVVSIGAVATIVVVSDTCSLHVSLIVA